MTTARKRPTSSTPRRRRRMRNRPVRVLGTVAMTVALLGALSAPAAAYPRPGATERVSIASDGTEANSFTDPNRPIDISADGRHVAFVSDASNLVPDDTNGGIDVFVHDRETRVTERVSVASGRVQSDRGGFDPSISGDGRYVAFASDAFNLAPEGNTSCDFMGFVLPCAHIYVHDRETGATQRVSVASDGTSADGVSIETALSADGRYVAFRSLASNLVPGVTNDTWDVYVHDRATGTTERVSVSSGGDEGNGASAAPAFSADGRYVGFRSTATNLVPGDTNNAQDVFVHDRETGTTERVSVGSGATQADSGSTTPALSGDGRYVAFRSVATNLVPGNSRQALDVYVHDRATRTTERVSVSSAGEEANGSSEIGSPAISADGRYVAFDSFASNLVPGDQNDRNDVFLHDRESGTTERVSAAADGTDGDHISVRAAVSGDGRHVAFISLASNLVEGDESGQFDAFVRDRGPATGVPALEAQRDGDALHVSGWATFSGQAVAAAEDPPDDGGGIGPLSARDLGAEIVGASVIWRVEEEDILLRLRLASLPLPTLGAAPAIVYRWSFTVGGTTYEVRSLRAAATAIPPGAPSFALYECALVCTETARLTGGIGTTGTDVRVSVPLDALGAGPGAELTGLEGSTAVGEAATDVEILDEVDLPDAAIAAPRVQLGVAPAGTPEAEVDFEVEANVADGAFSGTVEISALAAGDPEVWARACLADACGAARVPARQMGE